MGDEPHILVVDDETSIREPLAQYLDQYGFSVSEAANVPAARQILTDRIVDLVLLDVMMPGEDGLTLCREIRASSNVPVLFLTARTEDTDRIVGLELGADDYVTKPFNPRELVARIKAILRRAGGNGADAAPSAGDGTKSYIFAGFRLCPERRELTHMESEEEIVLTGGEFSLLLVLIERAGRVLSREQLLDLTQGREAALFDRSIDNQISRLRKKIEIDAKNPSLIKTVRGGGYVFASPVSQK